VTHDDFVEYRVDVHGTAVVHAKNEYEAYDKAVKGRYENLTLDHSDNARKTKVQVEEQS